MRLGTKVRSGSSDWDLTESQSHLKVLRKELRGRTIGWSWPDEAMTTALLASSFRKHIASYYALTSCDALISCSKSFTYIEISRADLPSQLQCESSARFSARKFRRTTLKSIGSSRLKISVFDDGVSRFHVLLACRSWSSRTTVHWPQLTEVDMNTQQDNILQIEVTHSRSHFANMFIRLPTSLLFWEHGFSYPHWSTRWPLTRPRIVPIYCLDSVSSFQHQSIPGLRNLGDWMEDRER